MEACLVGAALSEKLNKTGKPLPRFAVSSWFNVIAKMLTSAFPFIKR
jgi:hypothetical protein